MRIPEGGFGFHEIFRFSSLLNVGGSCLARELNRPEFGRIAGEYVDEFVSITEENSVIDNPTRAIARLLSDTVDRPPRDQCQKS
jgi:hypothetical protein